MPYESRAQQGLFHSPNSPVSAATVKKFDDESRGQKNLPYKKGKSAKQLFGKKKKQGKA